MLTEPFYWDLDDATRAWSKRFFERVGKMPNALQAGLYSSTTHYLQAVAKAGTDATEPVMQAMRAAPIDDFFAHDGHIRADGVMVHDMYLFQVKTPAESHYSVGLPPAGRDDPRRRKPFSPSPSRNARWSNNCVRRSPEVASQAL